MEDNQTTGLAWIVRIATGVFLGSALFALASWAAFSLWFSNAFEAPHSDAATQIEDNADAMADNLEAMADQMEAASNETLARP